MKEPIVDLKLAIDHGLSEVEFEKVREFLGRDPNYTELGMYSVMWSEHCSYKNSIAQIKTLPRSGKHLLVDAGEENAGLVDVGGGLAVAFKIESHNHPSAVEPYQGAATGVGGIMRDVFSMGARPICSLNSLRFGDPDDPTTRFLFHGVVAGIADYGNCLGIPTVGGEIYFDESYQGNPLVNAMTVGVVEADKTASAISRGEGNLVFLVGASTGRDGIHGATFASVELTEESQERKSAVQVGDPFREKVLMEATLDLARQQVVVGMQDMGAAGITCSTSEMSAKGLSGMRIDLDKVHIREEGMTPYEILLSESQERMLVVIEPDRQDAMMKILEKWDVEVAHIGEVTTTGLLEFYEQGELKAVVPADSLVLGGGAPVYEREWREPEQFRINQQTDAVDFPAAEYLSDAFHQLLASPNIASRRVVYQQYDHMIGAATVVRPGGDGAVVKLLGTDKYISSSTDCNSRYVKLDPRQGAMQAVAEAARNVAVTGARPLAITNCLNFGNPMDPEIYWEFKESIRGMGEACRYFNTPVTGGNVSFYNESETAAVNPTPVIGMVGLIESGAAVTPAHFQQVGDLIFIAGRISESIGGSEYQRLRSGQLKGRPPQVDLEHEHKLQQFLYQSAHNGLLQSAHDVSTGGLAVALARCGLVDPECLLGCHISLDEGVSETGLRPDVLLFSEAQGVVVISVKAEHADPLVTLAAELGLPLHASGQVIESRLIIDDYLDESLIDLGEIYFGSLPRYLNQ